jgi:hypothetical protein
MHRRVLVVLLVGVLGVSSAVLCPRVGHAQETESDNEPATVRQGLRLYEIPVHERSASGTLKGPWTQLDPLVRKDSGHGPNAGTSN